MKHFRCSACSAALLLGILLLFTACSHATRLTATSGNGQGEYDVYLLIGQSNMAGRGTLLPTDTLQPLEGVWLLNAEGQPEPAVAPLNKYSTIRKQLSMQQAGPGNSFGPAMHRHSGRKILLVVNARGGSSIRSWMPGAKDGYLEQAVRRTRQALHYGPLRGILWHQGESDARHCTHYMEQLQEMVASLRRQLGAGNVPFVAGEIARWLPERKAFNPIIRTIDQHIPNSSWVSSRGCQALADPSDPHFSRDGQRRLGLRYAEKMQQMQARQLHTPQ